MNLGEKLVLETFWNKIKRYFATKLYVSTLKSSKQNTLIAGKGIRIVNNVISNSLFPYKHKNEQGEWVIEGNDEKVIVTLFGPDGFNLSNRQITLTYYQNNEPILPERVITKTTDENGIVIFSSDDETGVPIGYLYEITFPKISNYLEITPEKHTAGVIERNIEVTYVPLPTPEDDDYGEEIIIHLDKFEDNTVTPFEGVDISVKIGSNAATTYTTDVSGNTIAFKVRYGLSYTVTAPNMTDYYIPAAAYTLTYTSEKRRRDISFTYKFIKVGVFIVDKNGNEYTGEEWELARDTDLIVTNEDAILLKIVTSTLAAHSGIFAVDIDNLRLRSYGSNILWANLNITFNNIPSGNNSNNNYYYNGYAASNLIQIEGNERGIGTGAVDKCLNLNKVLLLENNSEIILKGFLGSAGLWSILWNSRETVDSLLDITRPESEKLEEVIYYTFSSLTSNKWTSTQNNILAYYFSNNVVSAYKTTSLITIPFYTI